MKTGLILFGYVDPNRYSISTLMGAIETNPELLTHYDFHFLPSHLYESPLHEEELQKIPFQEYKYLILAFSLLSAQIPQFQEYCALKENYFQKHHNNIITIAGGPHIIAHPEKMAPFNIDFLILGEGEDAFQQLLVRMNNDAIDIIKKSPPDGIAIGKPSYSAAKPQKEIELGRYPPFSETFRLFAPIEISRGCPFRCKFCQTGTYSKCMRHVPQDSIVKWIKRAVEIKYDKVWFLTPNAFAYGGKNGIKANPTALHELLTAIKNIPDLKQINFGTFPSEVRPEFVTRELMEIISPLISNKYLVIGAQNASNKLLHEINRAHKFEDVLNAITILKDFGFSADLDFIFGLPGEDQEDITTNLIFFQAILDKKITNVKIHTHSFMPLPGTVFENAPVGKLDPRIVKIMGQLANEGKAYGEHMAQAQLVKTKFNTKLIK